MLFFVRTERNAMEIHKQTPYETSAHAFVILIMNDGYEFWTLGDDAKDSATTVLRHPHWVPCRGHALGCPWAQIQ